MNEVGEGSGVGGVGDADRLCRPKKVKKANKVDKVGRSMGFMLLALSESFSKNS